MREIELPAADLINALLNLSERETICLLDSCGVANLGSHLLIAGIRPFETHQITAENAVETLGFFSARLSDPNLAYIFSVAYDFGLKLENIKPRRKEFESHPEPDIFFAGFECLVIHDYDAGRTYLTGDERRFDETAKLLFDSHRTDRFDEASFSDKATVVSNFTRDEYLRTVEKVQELIRRGDTYQTNLTQQFRARLPEHLTAQRIFRRLRESHPAPFAAFLKRRDDCVVSISPERFFKIQSGTIATSPIKGTRRRGATAAEDARLIDDLLNSEKDAAENTMIVDLLRNDLGRICRFGSVRVEKLRALETHPTLHHLVSTVAGELRAAANFADILKAVFPCGSITGAPKISTMRIIDELETANRGLSMGAVGCSIPEARFEIRDSETHHPSLTTHHYYDLSVAIRTMVVKNREAVFNVGGGIVIDSVPEHEYEESLLKAKALFHAVNGEFGG